MTQQEHKTLIHPEDRDERDAKNQLYRRIIEDYIEAYNRFDTEGMLRDMHDDVQFRNISKGEVNLITHGIRELRNQAEQAKGYFSEREQNITGMMYDGDDQVEVGINFKGILATDFLKDLKAGDKVEIKGKSIFKFKDDKIIDLQDISE